MRTVAPCVVIHDLLRPGLPLGGLARVTGHHREAALREPSRPRPVGGPRGGEEPAGRLRGTCR